MPQFNLTANQVLMFTARYRLADGTNCLYTAYYKVRQPLVPGVADSTQAITSFRANFETAFLAVCNSFCRWQETHLVDYILNFVDPVHYDDNFQVVEGTITGAMTNPQDCIVTKRMTPFVGRQNRGRFYFSGWIRDWAQNGILAGAGYAAASTALNNLAVEPLKLPNGTAYADPVLMHWNKDAEGKRISFSTQTITGAVTDSIVRTQRRRQVGRGM